LIFLVVRASDSNMGPVLDLFYHDRVLAAESQQT